MLLTAAGAPAQEIGSTVRADDLPPEFTLLWGGDGPHDRRWTLIGKNGRAGEQEKLSPELNVPRAIWHLPLALDRSLFKVEFTRPIRQGNTVFHLYVKADGDADTGRRDGGSHTGVDATFTLIDGDAFPGPLPAAGLGQGR